MADFDTGLDGTVGHDAGRRMRDLCLRLDEDALARLDDVESDDPDVARTTIEERLVLITEATLDLVSIKRAAYAAVAAIPRGPETFAIITAYAEREQSPAPRTLLSVRNTISRAERKRMARGQVLDDISAWWLVTHLAQSLIDGHEEDRASLTADLEDLAFLASHSTPDPHPRSVRDRLIELDVLLDEGLITPEEHTTRRSQILDEL